MLNPAQFARTGVAMQHRCIRAALLGHCVTYSNIHPKSIQNLFKSRSYFKFSLYNQWTNKIRYLFMMTVSEPLAKLRAALKAKPLDAPTLCAQLGLSQASFSRLWQASGPEVVRFGRARATRYALARTLGELDSPLPLYRVEASGEVQPFGQLHLLASDWYAFTPADGAPTELIEGLPWWMQDLRPQGFLGRLIPQQHRDLALPLDILRWSDDDTLRFAALRGEDLPGNLLLGNASYRRFLSQTPAAPLSGAALIADDARLSEYAERAQAVNQGEAPGSSAGGEQPKFTAQVLRPNGQPEAVIVKFSADLASPSGRRWADLLLAEHVALRTLAQHGAPHGIAACQSQLLADGTRHYLELTRFDRVGAHGRVGVVSLAAMAPVTAALDQNWSVQARLLQDAGLLSPADSARIALLDLFGALIGNSDRHPGNLALFWPDPRQLALAPVYDMLPMLYQPSRQGEIVPRAFNPQVLDRLDLRCLNQALPLALAFWDSVLEEGRFSPDFVQLASAHRDAIARLA
jgi:hypothetical protein